MSINHWRHAGAFGVFLAILIGLHGCAMQPTIGQCQAGSTEAQLACQEQVMFGDVAKGVLIGTILGGVVAFAVTGGRGGTEVLVGAIIGGTAGGVIAYLDNKRARAAGQPSVMADSITADLRADNRRLRMMVETAEQIKSSNRRPTDKEMEIIYRLSARIKEVKIVYRNSLDSVGGSARPQVVDELNHLEDQIGKLDSIYHALKTV